MKPKFIIFDLGGVIIDIDFDRTFQAFGKLSGKPKEELAKATFLTKAYEKYESGLISDNEFRSEIRFKLNINSSDSEIDDAWNALLLDFNPLALAEIQNMSGKTPLFLLSNTNRIHFQYCNQMLHNQLGGSDFHSLFDKLFLSYEMGCRKPGDDIYNQVIEVLDCQPNEILFIDDMEANIEVANRIGFQTIHLVDNKKIGEELKRRLS